MVGWTGEIKTSIWKIKQRPVHLAGLRRGRERIVALFLLGLLVGLGALDVLSVKSTNPNHRKGASSVGRSEARHSLDTNSPLFTPLLTPLFTPLFSALAGTVYDFFAGSLLKSACV